MLFTVNFNDKYPKLLKFNFEGFTKSSQIACPKFEFICLHVNFVVIPFYIYVVSVSSTFLEYAHSYECN